MVGILPKYLENKNSSREVKNEIVGRESDTRNIHKSDGVPVRMEEIKKMRIGYFEYVMGVRAECNSFTSKGYSLLHTQKNLEAACCASIQLGFPSAQTLFYADNHKSHCLMHGIKH